MDERRPVRPTETITTVDNLHYNHDTRLSKYREPAAIQELLQIISDIIHDDNREDDNEQIQITVGGRTVAFYCGGPQIEALYAFCDHIASENWYQLDFDSCTVATCW